MMTEAPAATGRYAVYYAPAPGDLWWLAGSHWLGRCAQEQQSLQQPQVRGVPASELHRLTAAPRRYGWHATLRAPFALAQKVSPQELVTALRHLARGLPSFVMPPLKVTLLDDFLALIPDPQHPSSRAIDTVAQACVTELQPLVAPLSPTDLARRRAAGLTDEEDALLVRWGYPFVLDHFRFHLSLTGSLRGVDPATVQALQGAAEAYFAPLQGNRFDSLALFFEPASGADFVLKEHMRMGA